MKEWLPTAVTILRGLECVVGSLLVCALVLFPRERAGIQEAIESFWIRLDDAVNGGEQWHSAAIREVAMLTNKVLDTVYGSRLISLQGTCVSICLGMSFVLHARANAFRWFATEPIFQAEWSAASLVAKRQDLLACAFLVTVAAAFLPKRWRLSVLSAMTVGLLATTMYLQQSLPGYVVAGSAKALPMSSGDMLVATAVLTASLLADIGCVAAIRTFVQLALPKLPTIAACVLAVFGCALYFGTPWLAEIISKAPGDVSFIVRLSFYANVPDWYVLMTFFAVGGSVIITRPLGAFVTRAVHSLAAEQVFEKYIGWLWAAGTSAIIDAITGATSTHLSAFVKELPGLK
jgi:hypothetical protein